jgi:hypothetical protein
VECGVWVWVWSVWSVECGTDCGVWGIVHIVCINYRIYMDSDFMCDEITWKQVEFAIYIVRNI